MHDHSKDAPDTVELTHEFIKRFGKSSDADAISAWFSPGRVNLIGEYTDFTGGLVFPCAIDRGTTLIVRRTHDNSFGFASTNDAYTDRLTRERTSDRSMREWIRYPTGVINQFDMRGFDIDGVDLLFSGNIPSGAGLSSSASIGVVTAIALNALFQCGLETMDLVKLCQKAENDFVGTQCGIMDQFAVAMGQEDHALYLDCGSLDYRTVPMQLGPLSVVIADTRQVRENSESAYNDRVAECEQALALLGEHVDIKNLAQATPNMLTQHATVFDQHPVVARRVTHVVNENERVRAAVSALENSDFKQFGRLMDQSHASLRDLFEVSSVPLDHMVRISREQPGVLGARLTGAGFGGCTISLVPTEAVAAFEHNVTRDYFDATSLEPAFYTFRPAAGARRLV